MMGTHITILYYFPRSRGERAVHSFSWLDRAGGFRNRLDFAVGASCIVTKYSLTIILKVTRKHLKQV